MARRQKATTTTMNTLATSDLIPPTLKQPERHNTNRRQGTITARVYALYTERGYRHGYDLKDWLDVEREILSRAPPW